MRILKAKGPLSGFWAVGLDEILPEAVDSGEHWEAAGYRVGPHLHRHWEIGYVAEGTTRMGIMGGREIHLKPGSVWCFPPNINHWVEHGNDLKHHLMWVGFDLRTVENRHPDWKALQSLSRISSVDNVTHLERYFLQTIREATTQSLHQAAGLRLSLDALVLEVLRAITESSPSRSRVALHPGLSKALGILESRFRETWTLNKLAAEVGLSRSRLAELFSREAGCSIHKYLTKVRVRHAETLLAHSDLPIGDIASECGFGTIQHCSRTFSALTGQTPLEFRRLTTISKSTDHGVEEDR
jgi:AraC-like DNA-binding protein